MIISSKDATDSSLTPAQGSHPKLASPHERVVGSPPSYYVDSQTAGSSNAGHPSPSASRALPPPTTFMSVHSAYGPINDIWVIDTNVQIPEALLPPLPVPASSPTRPNLALHSAGGSIKGSVFLVSTSSDRAVITADTRCGKVALQVARVGGSNQPFKLVANTNYGDMIIGLPRDYVGPLRYKAGWCKTAFSTALRTRVVEISSETGFVGDLQGSGFADYRTWPKDEVDVETTHGNITFMYVDETPPPKPAEEATLQQKMEVAGKTALGWFELFLSRPRRRARMGYL